MKKTLITATLTIPLILAACSDAAEEAETVTVTETAEEETGDPADETEEPAEPETTDSADPEESEQASSDLPQLIEVTTANLVTGYHFEGPSVSVSLRDFDGEYEPLALGDIALDDETAETIAAAYEAGAAEGCEVDGMAYNPMSEEPVCAGTAELVEILQDATKEIPGSNPFATSLTYRIDNPNADPIEDAIAVDGLHITDGPDVREISGQDSATYLMAVATLLNKPPSNEVCDTFSGATISIDTDEGNIYEGSFGECDLPVPDYEAFNTITDIIGAR